MTQTNMTDARFITLMRYFLDNHIRVEQTGTDQWRVLATGGATGLDTTRVYSNRDEALIAVINASGVVMSQAA